MLDFDLIETPENVELQRRLAGIGSRFIAGFLDTLILGLLMLLLVVAALVAGLGVSTFGGGGAWGVAILIVLLFVLYWGYFVFFEMVTNGQSPGKRNQRIRVVKDGGGPITFTDVAIRNLLRAVDFLGGYAVAGVFMFFTKKAQRLGDLAAGTVVVSEVPLNYSAREGKGTKTQWEPPANAEALRGSGLSPADFRVLSNYMIRRSELTLEARDRLVRTLVVPILERNGVVVSGQTTAAIEIEVEQLVQQVTAGEAGSASPPEAGR